MGVKDLLAKLGDKQKGVPPPIPHATRPATGNDGNTVPRPGESSGKSFVVARNGNLQLEDGTPFRFASLNAPELLGGHEFEVEDTMRTLQGFGRRVTRSYTLSIAGTSPHVGDAVHVRGWDVSRRNWVYNEEQFKKMDNALAMAEKYDVRVIIPIVNQDFGSHHNNWAGNWVDIVRHVKNVQWNYDQAKHGADFFTDRECIDAFKQLVSYLLNRVNSITGKRYGDDPNVLAWETGNELQYSIKGQYPPPGAWTIEVAQHIKQLAPQTLVMDGSFAKCDSIEKAYATEVLRSPYIDLLSYHYYGNGDSRRVKKDVSLARKHGKVFIAGEYGFLDHANDYAIFLSAAEKEGCGGSLVWSLRPHSAQGGFKTHREDESNCAYHAPGWPSAVSPHNFTMPKDWDQKENSVITYIRHASFSINGEGIPAQHPTPNAPSIWLNNGGLSWRGGAWANTYEVWIAAHEQTPPEQWKCIGQHILDTVNEGRTWFGLPQGLHGQVVKMRGIAVDGAPGHFSEAIQI